MNVSVTALCQHRESGVSGNVNTQTSLKMTLDGSAMIFTCLKPRRQGGGVSLWDDGMAPCAMGWSTQVVSVHQCGGGL